jgi:hypothetical protein
MGAGLADNDPRGVPRRAGSGRAMGEPRVGTPAPSEKETVMFQPKRPGRRKLPPLLAGAIGIGGALAAGARAAEPAPAGEPTTQELLEELKALRAKVEQLEAAQARQDGQPEASEVGATVDRVLRDADRRSQLLQPAGFTAGYTKDKFVIQSEDGDFSLSPSFQFQARYVLNYRDEDAPTEVAGDAANESGLEIRRMKVTFDGNVFGPDTKYKFQWASNRNGGNLVLEEAYVTHAFTADRDLAVKAGQYKDVTFHEEATSSKRQLAVERSLANEVLAGGQTDFIQGVALQWDDGPEGLPFKAEVGYTDGPNSDNTSFVDAGGAAMFGVADPEFGAYGRGEYFAFGNPKYYEDFSALGNAQDLLVFGAGAFYAQSGDDKVLFHTFDAQYEMNRLGLYAAYYGVLSDSGAAGTSYDVGGVAQAGYMLSDKFEVFGRYSVVSLDSDVSGDEGGEDTFHELTGGVNYFIRRHAAKLTADVVYLPSGVPSDQSGLGELDPDADDDQILFRGQFQLLL